MIKKEYLEHLSKKRIESKKVTKVQEIYGAEFPEIVNKIISNSNESIFFDDGCRMLSFDEIVDAENDLHVDFKEKGIIPLVDCGENDFVVYHFKDAIWSKFNIIDETVFKKKNCIDELL